MENKDYLENICNMISEIARIAKELLCDIHKQISQSIIAIATIAHEIMLEMPNIEYYGAAEPPVRCGVSHLSGLTEPPVYSYSA